MVRTILAFAAGAALTLLLVFILREAPSSAPESPDASPPTSKRRPGDVARSTAFPSRRAPAPGSERTLARADADEQTAPSGDSTRGVEKTEASSAAAVPIVGLGGRYQAKPGSKVRIEGTSNIHDWQVEGNILGGQLDLGADFPLDPASAQPGKVAVVAAVSIPVRSLKSVTLDGHPFNAKMDDIMYELLREETYKSIRYELGELSVTNVPGAAGEPLVFVSTGELVVAGATNPITMPVSLRVLSGDRLSFSGSASVKMTDFGIKPPEPLGLGIKTGDDVKLIFDWVVGRKNP